MLTTRDFSADTLKGAFKGALINGFSQNQHIGVVITTSGVLISDYDANKQTTLDVTDALSVAVAHADRMFYIGNTSGSVVEYKTADGNVIESRRFSMGKLPDNVWELVLHPTRDFLLACGGQEGASLISLEDGTVHKSPVQGISTRGAFSGDGNLIAVNGGPRSNEVTVYEIVSFFSNLGKNNGEIYR